MAKFVLALNAGSSSLKASLIKEEEHIVTFLAERLTTPDAIIHVKLDKEDQKIDVEKSGDRAIDHSEALSQIIRFLKNNNYLSNLVAVGHRVVHGGTLFTDSAKVTDETFEQISSVSHLAPL